MVGDQYRPIQLAKGVITLGEAVDVGGVIGLGWQGGQQDHGDQDFYHPATIAYCQGCFLLIIGRTKNNAVSPIVVFWSGQLTHYWNKCILCAPQTRKQRRQAHES
jgi:hypothetical protein